MYVRAGSLVQWGNRNGRRLPSALEREERQRDEVNSCAIIALHVVQRHSASWLRSIFFKGESEGEADGRIE